MSRQQMSFQLSYAGRGGGEGTTTCKSCKGSVAADSLMVGVQSDSMYDPMWYHFHCFWTRCWYRKQMGRHVADYAQLAGFTAMSPEDQERFVCALEESTEGQAGAGVNTGMKRRSVSDDNIVDAVHKKRKPDTISLPKLSLSATGFLSKSASNLADTGADTGLSKSASNLADTRADTASSQPTEPQETVVVSNNMVVTVRKTAAGTAVLITSNTDVSTDDHPTFSINLQQWREMTTVFDDVRSAITSMTKPGGQDVHLTDCPAVRVVSSDTGQVCIAVTVEDAKGDNTHHAEDQNKGTTFTPDVWQELTTKADDIDAAILRVSN